MANNEILKGPLLLVSGDRALVRLIALECRELALPLEVADTLPALAEERPMLLDLDSAGVMEALTAAGGEFATMAGICRDLTRLPAEVQARLPLLLQRPFLTGQVRALLAQLGGRGEMIFDDTRDYTPGKSVSAADVALELTGEELKVGERRIHLTPSEAAILRLLMDRRGEAVSREELREALSGQGESNKLEVYLCFLRRKIERPLGLHMITTVRGVGYRLE
jgi:hypothetical protein